MAAYGHQSLCRTGTPEAQGKTDYLLTVVSSLNRWQASTLGLSMVWQWLHGSLQLHQSAMREVGAGPACPLCMAACDALHSKASIFSTCPARRPICVKRQTWVTQVLSTATEEELSYMLLHINCPALVEVADGAIMQLLTSPQHRLPDLTTLARCLIRPCTACAGCTDS